VELIGSLRSSIKITNLDAEIFFLQNMSIFSDRTLMYCDPPYFDKANRLYKNHYNPGDHARIASIIQKTKSVKWMVSYDKVDQILEYYESRRKFTYKLQYNALNAYKGDEVFILSDDLIVPRISYLPHIAEALRKNSPILHPELSKSGMVEDASLFNSATA
jgi:DNA adenine methylase